MWICSENVTENTPGINSEAQNQSNISNNVEKINVGKDESKQDDIVKPLSITKPESPAVLLCPMVRLVGYLF
jgi:hypothetical protein